MESLECSVCNEVYNTTDRRPKTLDCGHTICLWDLKDLARSKTPFCPFCAKKCTKAPDAYPDNQIILGMLGEMEVRCREHQRVAKKFCLTHIRVVCEECKHSCPLKTLPQDINEVRHVVIEAISQLSTELQGKLDKSTKAKVDRRFNELLRDNLTVLHTLKELKIALNNIQCIHCCKCANTFLLTTNFEAYCSEHFTPGAEVPSVDISLEDLNQPRICAEIKAVLPKLLKKINFYDLTKDDLDILEHLPETPKELQQFGLSLIRRACIQIGSFDTVPDVFFCPACKETRHKADTKLSVVPCREALHAICQHCAVAKKREAGAICPLDKSQFGQSFSMLKVIPEEVQKPVILPPEVAGSMSSRSVIREMPQEQGYSPYDQQLHQYHGVGPYGGLPGPQIFQLPQLRPGLPQQFNPLPPAGMPQFPQGGMPFKQPELKPNLPRQISYLQSEWPITRVDNPPNSYVLHRFSALYSKRRKSQAEALVFLCTEPVKLTGVSISMPQDGEQAILIESINLYRGVKASGVPIFTHRSRDPIKRDSHLFNTVILFSENYELQPFQKYALAMYFSGNPVQEYISYEGNIDSAQEECTGEDLSWWQFEKYSLLNMSETGGLADSTSILSIIYQR